MSRKKSWKKHLMRQLIEENLSRALRVVEEEHLKQKQESLRNTLGNIMRDIGESENEIPKI